jgi:S-adenosylmethionine uptake transporter
VIQAALWMIITIVSFLAMAVAARQLSQTMSTFEILSFRSLIGILILLPLVLRRGGSVLRTHQPLLHIGRNVVHFGGQFGWVVGVSLLPLAQVFALEFTTPIWVALLAAVFLHERLTRHRVIVVVLGFVGVMIILRPGIDVIQPAALVVLGAAMCFAGSVVMVKLLTRRDAPLAVIFYMSLIQLPMGLIPALFDWVVPAWSDVPLFLIVGISALSAHYAMARALMVADASVIFPIDFLRLPAAAVLGYLVYSEALDSWTLLGAAVIFGANYYGVLRESRAL